MLLMAKLLLFILFIITNPFLVFSQFDEFFFNGFSEAQHNNKISLNGSSEIKKNGILQLTNDTSRSTGHAIYQTPFQFKNSTNGKVYSFSTSFAFAIVSQYQRLGGHGFAFTISPDKLLNGFPSPYLGVFNPSDVGNISNHVFAVEFDTVQDFEFGDIDDNHIGIDIDGLNSTASVSAAYFAENSTKVNITLKSGNIFQVWIDYDSIENVVNVSISPFSWKPKQPILSTSNIDLSSVFEDSMYVGFSSSTGLLASSHYILGWNFKMNGISRNLDLGSLPSLPGPKKKHVAVIIGVSVSSILLLIVAVCFAIYLFIRIKNADVIEDWELDVGPHRFSYEELKTATKGFKEKELLGVGGFGKVYKGRLPNSKDVVAVKRISHDSKQGLHEFVSEIGTIGRLRHRNLVQLQGWCRRRGDLLLVYDYMPNGSLDKYIYREPKFVLSWEQRFKIIKGISAALLYLHEQWEQIVVHRDIKASNILLDGEFNGRLGDFGLAKLYEHGSNPGTTRIVGTLGYLAPELTKTGKATPSSDVFAFGALLLETCCGRRPIEPKAVPAELTLIDWVWDKWTSGLIFDVVDPRLKDEFDEDEVLMVLKLGLMCSNCAPAERPSMRQLVRYLEKEVKMPEVLSAPGENETDRNDIGFDDFIHSYPSHSFDKSLQSSKEVRNDAIDNDSDQDQTAASSGSLYLLSTRHDKGR
ncbi:hypothetical protein MKW98_018502 [Papaver atlanticum]|uniref:non-specific serine/threonine protein kinase n=1 Tax=Papaver atlanticum TaxID=357466 RepID=A0AAD4TGB1_9MAGN|nr:hypothetical protein MKW98_018502 [Papaver atlanticum]